MRQLAPLRPLDAGLSCTLFGVGAVGEPDLCSVHVALLLHFSFPEGAHSSEAID